MEFLVRLALDLHAVPAAERDRLLAAEREAALRLRRAGTIVRMWRLPGQSSTVSVWRAVDATELHARLTELPLMPWMAAEVTALAAHYVDDEPVA